MIDTIFQEQSPQPSNNDGYACSSKADKFYQQIYNLFCDQLIGFMTNATLKIIIIFLLILIVRQASIASTTDYNRYMAAYSYTCTITNGTLGYHSEYFASTFTNTIEVAEKIHYSTQNIDARLYENNFTHNSSHVNLEYYLEVANITTTSLVTSIEGYFQSPLYRLLTYRYLLIFPNNPWLNKYMVIETVNCNISKLSSAVLLPSSYIPGHSLSTGIQIRDAKYQFSYSGLSAYGTFFKVEWGSSINATSFTLILSMPPYFLTVSNNQVRMLIILIDTTTLSADYPQYIFVSYFTFDTNTNRIYAFPYSTSLQYGSYMFGLSTFAFHLNKEPSFYFILTYNGSSLRPSYYGNVGQYHYFSYSITYFLYFRCRNPDYPNFRAVDRLCYTPLPCNTSLFYDYNNKSCTPCRFDCLICNNSFQCLTCNTTYRYLYNYNCLPIAGYFQSNTSIPLPCNANCVTCQNTSTTCTSCPYVNTMTINNKTCKYCQDVYSMCYSCNQTACLTCLNGYRLVNSTYCSLPCNDTNCFICNNSNILICYTCRVDYMLATNITTNITNCIHMVDPVCGNGKIQGTQTCDDGNLKELDGCNATCQMEPNYNCYKKYSILGFNYTHYCSYTKGIQFTLISIQKLEYSNEIQIVLSIVPYQHKFWSTQSTLSYFLIQTPIPYRNMRIQFTTTTYSQSSKLATPITKKYPQSSLMKITFEYLKSIQGQSIMLGFNFSSSIDTSLTEIPPYSVSLVVNPQNNRYAHLYSQNIYKNQKMLDNICLLAAVLSFVLFIISLVIGSKRIIVEMLIVIQITYVSLIAVPQLSPMYSALTVLSIANNGFNVMYSSSLRPFEDTLSDERTKGVQLYSQLLYNINTGLLFIIIPLLIGLVMFIVSKAKDLSQERLAKVKSIYQKALGEYTFVGLMFGGCIIGASTVIEIKYGMVDISTQVGLFSLVATGVLPILYILYAVIRVKCPHLFDEYTQQLNSSNQFSLVFQITCFFLWPSLSAIVCVFYSVWFINSIIIVLCFILYIITLIKPIFMKPIDRYRTQLNLLTILFAQIPYLYANVRTGYEYKDDNQLSIMAPAAIGFLLMINISVNLSYFTYETIKMIRTYLKNNKHKADEQNFYSKKSKLTNPLKNIRKFKLDGFIEYTQKDEMSYRSLSQVKKSISPLDAKRKIGELQQEQKMLTKSIIKQEEFIHGKFNQIDML